jgi:hypothetical protein
MKRAMVVGGQHAFVKNRLTATLARHGISVAAHWTWDKAKPPTSWPKGMDLIYICTDMVSHKVSVPAMTHAREAGIPYVHGTRKWAESLERLTSAGFPLLNPREAIQAIIKDHTTRLTPEELANGATEQEMRAIAIAVLGSVEMVEAMISTPDSPEDSTPFTETTMPSLAAALASSTPASLMATKDAYSYARDLKSPLQVAYIRVLLKDPEASNKKVGEAVTAAGFKQKFDPIRATMARQFCGISHTGSGPTLKKQIDEEKFLAAAIALNVDDFNLPAKPAVNPVPVPTPEPEVKTAPVAKTLDLFDKHPKPAVSPEPIVSVADLLRKLKAAMAAENYTELHITESGVQFKRVQVTEGTLDI